MFAYNVNTEWVNLENIFWREREDCCTWNDPKPASIAIITCLSTTLSPGLCTLGFIRTALVEKTQPELLHGLVRWARSRSAYHLSTPSLPSFPPFPSLLLSPSPAVSSLLLPLSESSLPHWQALIFSSPHPSFISLSLSFSLFHPSLIFFCPNPLTQKPPPPPPLPSLSPPRLLRVPSH